MLRRYLKYQKTVIAMSRKVVSTLVYPAILIALSIALIAILMTYVIPRFTEFFSDFEEYPYQPGASLNSGNINYGLLRQQEAMERLKKLENLHPT